MMLDDIAALGKDDPIKIFFQFLPPWPAPLAGFSKTHIEAIAARQIHRDNATATELTRLAREALSDPGPGLTSGDRFIQDVIFMSLDCPLPTSVGDYVANTIWNLGRIANGVKDLEHYPQGPPRRLLPDAISNNKGHAKKHMIDTEELGGGKDFSMAPVTDLCPVIQEYHVYIRNAVRPTVHFDCAGRPYSNMPVLHTILRATSRSGRSYCLDFTGAQFGWDDPCSDWDAFAATRLYSVERVERFGTACGATRRAATEPGPAKVPMEFFCKVTEKFKDTVWRWFEKEGRDVKGLLELGAREFEMVAEGLLQDVVDEFGRVMDEMERQKEYYLVLRDGAVHIEKRPLKRRRARKWQQTRKRARFDD
ncbi:MAG: hypothetical protein Q9165_001675 [Trypethelium subeluteriae]